ncbi:MAG: hypothetical protein R2709_00515 [Marmoricola sp.]
MGASVRQMGLGPVIWVFVGDQDRRGTATASGSVTHGSITTI